MKKDRSKGRNIVKTFTEVCRAFCISRPTGYKWKKKGLPVREDGWYDLTAIAKWSGMKHWSEKKIDDGTKAEVIALSENTQMTEDQIGENLGISRRAVHEIKRMERENRDLVDLYKSSRADLMVIEQGRNLALRNILMDGVKEDDTKDLGLKDRVDIYAKLGEDTSKIFKDERLETDKSTENAHFIFEAIMNLKEKDKELGSETD